MKIQTTALVRIASKILMLFYTSDPEQSPLKTSILFLQDEMEEWKAVIVFCSSCGFWWCCYCCCFCCSCWCCYCCWWWCCRCLTNTSGYDNDANSSCSLRSFLYISHILGAIILLSSKHLQKT